MVRGGGWGGAEMIYMVKQGFDQLELGLEESGQSNIHTMSEIGMVGSKKLGTKSSPY